MHLCFGEYVGQNALVSRKQSEFEISNYTTLTEVKPFIHMHAHVHDSETAYLTFDENVLHETSYACMT